MIGSPPLWSQVDQRRMECCARLRSVRAGTSTTPCTYSEYRDIIRSVYTQVPTYLGKVHLPSYLVYLRNLLVCQYCMYSTYGRYRTLCCGTCLIALVHNAVLWSLFHVQVLHIKVCQCLPQQVTSCSASCLIFPVHLRRFHVKGVREPKVL